MFKWDDKYKFIFSDLGSSDRVGVNNVGIGVFKKKPYIGLTKEILQNSTDAFNSNLPEGTPVKVRFELLHIDRDDIPDVEHLNDVIHKCAEYYSTGDDGEKLKYYKEAAEKYLDHSGKVPVLKISDYNTKGLCGVRQESGSNWSGLVREQGATNKSNDESGAFGVGKFAPFTFSDLRTVFYSTKTINDEIAFQGKAILTTFKENDVRKHNIGLFADSTSGDNYDAVLVNDEIAPVFRRDEIGTDIFVLGFKKDDDWMEQSAISVIENFFYAIYKGRLEVEIVEEDKVIVINQSTLGDKIAFYKEYCDKYMKDDVTFQFTAPSYWKMLNGSHKMIKESFVYKGKNMGEYELYLYVGEEAKEKKVLEMRQAGMKIREDNGFRIQANFTGIFIATGNGASSSKPNDNISSFLRKCENQAHDDWAANEYSKEIEEREKATKIINQIHSIILEAVKKEMPKFDEESVGAFGMNKFLHTDEEEEDKKEEKSFSDFKPLAFEIKCLKTGQHRRQADISIKKNGGSKRKTKDKDKDDDKKKEKQTRKPNNKRGKGTGKADEIYLSNVKTPYDNATGEYVLSFVVNEKVSNLMLSVKIGSDDDNLALAEIASASHNGNKLKIKNGMIEIGIVDKGVKKVLRIKLFEEGRKTLEVRAYAER